MITGLEYLEELKKNNNVPESFEPIILKLDNFIENKKKLIQEINSVIKQLSSLDSAEPAPICSDHYIGDDEDTDPII